MSSKKDTRTAAGFKALGHPVRIQIFTILKDNGACFAGDLSDRLPVAASTTSQHLKIMKDAGLISDVVDGPHRVYSINKPALQDLKSWVRKL